LINRLFIVQSKISKAPNIRENLSAPVPRELELRLRDFASQTQPQFGTGIRFEVRQARWANDEVADAAQAFIEEMHEKCKDLAWIVSRRVPDIAQRLATTYAISINPADPVVDMRAWNWGKAMALQSGNMMQRECSERIFDDERQRLLFAIDKWIRKPENKKHLPVTVNVIRKFCPSKTLSATEYNKVVETLLDLGDLQIAPVKSRSKTVQYIPVTKAKTKPEKGKA
jgi:hypothetical protein